MTLLYSSETALYIDDAAAGCIACARQELCDCVLTLGEDCLDWEALAAETPATPWVVLSRPAFSRIAVAQSPAAPPP